MSQQDAPYEFGDLPLSGVGPGTRLLVTGAGRVGTRLARALVLAGRHREEGMILVSTRDTGREVATDCATAWPDLDSRYLGVVDATGSSEVDTDTGARVEAVSSTGDLTGISIEFSRLYSSLYANGVRRIRTCFDSLSMLLMYTEFRTLTRFVHTLGGRISATDGFGVFVLDPSMHETQVKSTLAHLCDGTVEVRRAGDGHELRVRGLDGQPADWTAVGL